ncbi:protein SSUH2 homolog isoform X2 [Heteronotia binoei]|uniref:protein SSUH2 homolog isoform X2 n=1 Tax=Heteronotia binoei TaxID=13085 RepID=UPI002930F167|nr:protein SSUH2 homolog isoform X2 [Heteronotia binoei]
MEKGLLIGDRKSCASYGSDCLVSVRTPEGASGPCSAYEGASAPPFELLGNSSREENKIMNGGKSGHAEQLPQEENEEFGPHQRDLNTLYVSEQDVKEALLQHVSSKHFYRSSPAKHMKVQNIIPLNTYRYHLETFTEHRQTHQASELYDGGFIDSYDVAPPPAPWDIVVDPPPLFTDCEMHIPIPHTYSVENCPDCKGRGSIICPSCRGAGKKTCSSCNGSGTTWEDGFQICTFCGGSGKVSCFKCRSSGKLKCHRCNGSGVLLFHTELTIIWKNNISEHVVDKNSGFPIYRLQEVTGKEIFSDENSLVYPIINFPEPSISEGSRACIEQHRIQFASESCILIQKQAIEVVPVSKVEYEWKGKLHSFYVYGNEKKVYAEDYPGKFCSVM